MYINKSSVDGKVLPIEDIDDEKVKIQSHVDTHGIAVLSPAEKLIYEVSKFSGWEIELNAIK